MTDKRQSIRDARADGYKDEAQGNDNSDQYTGPEQTAYEQGQQTRREADNNEAVKES